MARYETDANNALQEYLKAVNDYIKLLEKYFPIRQVIPGVVITTGNPITKSVLEELKKAERKVNHTHREWDRLLELKRF
jgi:hypothetical protein